MTHYLRLSAPIAPPAHRIGATRDDGDTVYLEIDDVIGSVVLACGSAVHLSDYEGRYEVVTALPGPERPLERFDGLRLGPALGRVSSWAQIAVWAM